MTENPTREHVNARSPAVAQAFLLLDELAEEQNRLPLNELVRRAELPKSTVHRLLHTLMDVGAIVRDQRGAGYHISGRMAAYSRHTASANTGMLGMFYALAERIRDEHDETVQLGVLTGREVTFIAHVDTSQPVRLFTKVGRRLPAHASATGKALLAFRERGDLDAVLASGLPALTEKTITTERELRKQLQTVREHGYAGEIEESSANLSCFSAPVLDRDSRSRAAVTVCVANNSVPQEHAESLRHEVIRAASEMSRQI